MGLPPMASIDKAPKAAVAGCAWFVSCRGTASFTKAYFALVLHVQSAGAWRPGPRAHLAVSGSQRHHTSNLTRILKRSGTSRTG